MTALEEAILWLLDQQQEFAGRDNWEKWKKITSNLQKEAKIKPKPTPAPVREIVQPGKNKPAGSDSIPPARRGILR